MSTISNSEFIRSELAENAKGGTELLAEKLVELMCEDMGEKFNDVHISVGRIRGALPEDKIRVYWCHDLPGDPECDFLANAEYRKKFHKLVFVSNWQMQRFIEYYNLPWDQCLVIQNAIDPIDPELIQKPDPKEEIRLIYHTTPHRGLNILAAVMEELVKQHDNLRLDVYSSLAIYGWEDSDNERNMQPIYDKLKSIPGVYYHGTASNEEVRAAVAKAHIFAYPSIWKETSCRCLMEAMSAGCLSVHSNLAALPETAANWSQMYQYDPEPSKHAGYLLNVLNGCINSIEGMMVRGPSTKGYADVFYNWHSRRVEWSSLLNSLVDGISDRSFPEPVFTINTNV